MHIQSALYGFLTVDLRPLAVRRGVYTAFHAITAARVKLIRRRNRAGQSVRAADVRLPHRARTSYEKRVRRTSFRFSHRPVSGRRRVQSSANRQQICIEKMCHREGSRRGAPTISFLGRRINGQEIFNYFTVFGEAFSKVPDSFCPPSIPRSWTVNNKKRRGFLR